MFELANVDYTYSGSGSGVTGDGTLYTCLWNSLSYDYNADFSPGQFPGAAKPGTARRFYCSCAGKYHFTARVALSGIEGSNTSVLVQLYASQNGVAQGTYSAQQPLPGGTSAGNTVVAIDQNIVLNEGDFVEVRVMVSGNKTANVSVFSDATNGFAIFDGYLV